MHDKEAVFHDENPFAFPEKYAYNKKVVSPLQKEPAKKNLRFYVNAYPSDEGLFYKVKKRTAVWQCAFQGLKMM